MRKVCQKRRGKSCNTIDFNLVSHSSKRAFLDARYSTIFSKTGSASAVGEWEVSKVLKFVYPRGVAWVTDCNVTFRSVGDGSADPQILV